MSRTQQDQFIDDDEEEVCPLCVEELDLDDRGFRPCPCGYQICQFCYNNVKNNMNGLCPACRRQYNDNDIEYKVITPEESAAHKARQAQKQKKTQAAQQKEKQKAEAENLSRKHLAGLRVMQKNLVYVTGLTPNLQEDKLLQILRSDQYFGRYGEIIKIVVSKAKDTLHPQSVGVYVTYRRKEDAEQCIAAVDGSKNGDRVLRAQFGTTKYCSAYLRGENCPNRNCMFLHEPGEANESFSRAALSSFNAGQHGPERPPPQSQQPLAASQPMLRQASGDRTASPALDRPALPSTASWASKVPQSIPSRTESRSTSGTVESPGPVHVTPSQPDSTAAQGQTQPAQESAVEEAPVTAPPPSKPRRPQAPSALTLLVRNFNIDNLKLTFSMASLSPADAEIVANYPPLFDQNGGAKRRLRLQREEEQRRLEQEAQAFQQQAPADQEDSNELGGSGQLGGEPEERQSRSQPQSAIQPPGQDGLPGLDQRFYGGGVASPGISERGMTPQQQQQMFLQNMKGGHNQSSYLNNPSQSSSFGQQSTHPPGHQRNASRYSFANESSASTSVKPVANPKLLSQQSSIMPPTGNHFGGQHQQPHGSQFYTSNVQGPPPGLRATGTPPVGGVMTFGQGHGFATGGLQYSANAGRNSNEEMMRNLLVRRGDGPGAGGDQSKHDADFPPLATPSRQQSFDIRESDGMRTSTPPVPPGFEAHAKQQSRSGSLSESRRSTPTVPPGLSKPTAIPQDLDGGGSRPSSRASLRRTASSQIQPALPLKPSTPSRTGTPTPAKQLKRDEEVETPTKPPKGKGKVDVAPVEEPVLARAESTKPGAEQQSAEPVPKAETPGATPGTIVPDAVQPATKTEVQTTAQADDAAKSVPAAPTTPNKTELAKPDTSRRKAPGKLDIAAATHDNVAEVPSSTPAEHDSQSVASRGATQPPSAVASPSISSPAIKSVPKTLRVVQTPKTENPPGATVASTPKDQQLPTAARLPSRQPSVGSIQLPGTPSSEQVEGEDSVSVTSTSVSRASSPPPGAGKVGSAPLRPKTKNQLKKERQERAKALEAEKIEKAKAEETKVGTAAEGEEVQEAIVSRKKKTKKEKEPKPKPKVAVESAKVEQTPTEKSETAKSPAPPTVEARETVEKQALAPEPATSKATSSPAKAKNTRQPKTPPPTSHPSPTKPRPQPQEPSPPPTPTPAQILAELKQTAPASVQKCIDSLLRTPSTTTFKPSQPILPKDLTNPAMWDADVELNLTKEEVDALLSGARPSLHYGGREGRVWDRGMVTSTGAHLRALTQELEQRFLELEKALRAVPEGHRWKSAKPQNELRFPRMDLEGMRRSFEDQVCGKGGSVMERMVQDGGMSKKGAFLVDEAGKYINEFVMPPATPPGSQGEQVGQRTGGREERREVPSVEIAERQLNEAKRVAEERDGQLKKSIKKNKRVLGLG